MRIAGSRRWRECQGLGDQSGIDTDTDTDTDSDRGEDVGGVSDSARERPEVGAGRPAAAIFPRAEQTGTWIERQMGSAEHA